MLYSTAYMITDTVGENPPHLLLPSKPPSPPTQCILSSQPVNLYQANGSNAKPMAPTCAESSVNLLAADSRTARVPSAIETHSLLNLQGYLAHKNPPPS